MTHFCMNITKGATAFHSGNVAGLRDPPFHLKRKGLAKHPSTVCVVSCSQPLPLQATGGSGGPTILSFT